MLNVHVGSLHLIAVITHACTHTAHISHWNLVISSMMCVETDQRKKCLDVYQPIYLSLFTFFSGPLVHGTTICKSINRSLNQHTQLIHTHTHTHMRAHAHVHTHTVTCIDNSASTSIQHVVTAVLDTVLTAVVLEIMQQLDHSIAKCYDITQKVQVVC